MIDLLSALGVFIAIEGALYAGFPAFVKRMAMEVIHMDESDLRRGGVIALCLGVGLVWLVRG